MRRHGADMRVRHRTGPIAGSVRRTSCDASPALVRTARDSRPGVSHAELLRSRRGELRGRRGPDVRDGVSERGQQPIDHQRVTPGPRWGRPAPPRPGRLRRHPSAVRGSSPRRTAGSCAGLLEAGQDGHPNPDVRVVEQEAEDGGPFRRIARGRQHRGGERGPDAGMGVLRQGREMGTHRTSQRRARLLQGGEHGLTHGRIICLQQLDQGRQRRKTDAHQGRRRGEASPFGIGRAGLAPARRWPPRPASRAARWPMAAASRTLTSGSPSAAARAATLSPSTDPI